MAARRNPPAAAAPRPLTVKVVPAGPDRAKVEAAAKAILASASVQQLVKRGRYRLLGVDLVEPDDDKESGRRAGGQPRPRATIFDYAENRTLVVEGSSGRSAKLDITESGDQPLPTMDEFAAAVKVLERDGDLGPALKAKRLQPYPPMPPLLDTEDDSGRPERTLAVGLLPVGRARGAKHEIVGVNLVRRSVVRFERGAPDSVLAQAQVCGIPYTQQNTTGRAFVPGQAIVTVTQGNTTLWRFRVVRPAATAGAGRSTNGTGIELRNVDYRGKRVLYRAHVPILNVKYDPGGCGAFRDWQNEEGMIHATGANVAPGFRLCPTPARTILETGTDSGNFLGVGIYVDGQEVVLVSELEAGWYRYVSRWRLAADGTIKARFGFGAVENSCVCTVHHHHAYWRFDFDIRTPGKNVVREFNDPCLPAYCPQKWHTHRYEVARPRDPGRHRKWRVENTETGEGYEIVPGPTDGLARTAPDSPFGRSDVWILRYHANEIDDGVAATGPPYAANLGAFVNGESVRDTDVVVWYGGHFVHDVQHHAPGQHGHILGPTLRPVNW